MYIVANNGRIHFEVYGNGNPLVLLHGFAGSVNIWRDFAGELKSKFRVILIDLPGHGKSSYFADEYSMELMADSVKAVIDHLGLTSIAIIGHSMGGYVSLAFARKYKNAVKGLGLFHSTSLADTEEVKLGRDRAMAAIQGGYHSYLSGFIPELFAQENREQYRSEIEALIEEASQMEPKAMLAAQRGMKNRTSTLDVLINATFPVMFIAGQKDTRIPFENIWVQMALTEAGHSMILRNVGHMGFIEAKAQTLKFVEYFAEASFATSSQ